MKYAQGVTHQTVTVDDDGKRLDNWLQRALPGVPRGLIHKMIRSGQCRVDGKRVRSLTRLKVGQDVRIPPCNHRVQTPLTLAEKDLQAARASVFFENEHLLACNKPKGMPVHAGTGSAFGWIELMQVARQDCPSMHLVHRLDKPTTGCLLLAKSAQVMRKVQAVWANSVEKCYQVLLQGRWEGPPSVSVDASLRKRQFDCQHHTQLDSEGKIALSHFTCLQTTDDWSWCEVVLGSGRTHQIRAHSQHLGHPVVGDSQYGADPTLGDYPHGLFLHAWRLKLPLIPGVLEKPWVLEAAWQGEHQAWLEHYNLIAPSSSIGTAR